MTSAYDFDYTGKVQSFVVPAAGIYQFEVWGAQGGTNSSMTGGYGGYATGCISLSKNTTLYVVVGQQGVSGGTAVTFNGGGAGSATGGASGGGATHIALVTGELASLSSNKTDILIVAGGGGGGAFYSSSGASGPGGRGGGYIGGNGMITYSWAQRTGQGGTQSAGGNYGLCSANEICGSVGSFGLGGSKIACSYSNCDGNYQAGGGGGWYGGGSARHCGGGGGSGYIANSRLISDEGVTKHLAGYSVSTSDTADTKTISISNVSATATTDYAKTGNGYARIIFLKATETENFLRCFYTRTRKTGLPIAFSS